MARDLSGALALGAARGAAEAALALTDGRPRQALAAATEALGMARAEGDTAAAAIARRALGLVFRESGRPHDAVRELRASIRLAERGGFAELAAEGRMSLAAALVDSGAGRGPVMRAADAAVAGLRGFARARAMTQRALLLERLGRLDEALEAYRVALPVIRRAGDALWETRALNNRGVLQAYRGALAAADADLARAERIAAGLGQEAIVAKTLHNRGFVASRRGDVPAALALYDQATERFAALGLPLAALRMDRCETLLSVRLVREARRAAELAAQELDRARARTDQAEALLQLARACLLDGDPPAAIDAARAAARLFASQRRPGWLALARLALAEAAQAQGTEPEAALRAAARARRVLGEIGIASAAADAALVGARIALEQGRTRLARSELERAGRPGRQATAELAARAWHAEAMLRLLDGRRGAAEAALRAGHRAVVRAQATLAAGDLRAGVAAHGVEIAALGLRLAVEDGRAAAALGWADRGRSVGLLVPPARPPRDPALAADLAELRRIAREVEEAGAQGHLSTNLLRAKAGLEGRIQRRVRTSGAGSVAPPGLRRGLARLREMLGERVLVELAEVAGRLVAFVARAGRVRMVRLGDASPVLAEADAIRHALRRMVSLHPGDAERGAVALDRATRRADDLVLAPLADLMGDRSLVLVPTGGLHAMTWGALPSLRGRPVVVAPSAALWMRAAPAPGRAGGAREVVLVAGPALDGAEEEVRDLAALYPDALVLTGEDAAAEAVAQALDGAGLAHVAAHGTFRADNPLFSVLHMADGPLTIHDLVPLSAPPTRLVLSACDAGLAEVRPGDELIGFAAALLGMGSRTIVASLAPVPDREARPLMAALHDRLIAGDPPSAALAAASAGAGPDADPRTRAVAASFVCLGAD